MPTRTPNYSSISFNAACSEGIGLEAVEDLFRLSIMGSRFCLFRTILIWPLFFIRIGCSKLFTSHSTNSIRLWTIFCDKCLYGHYSICIQEHACSLIFFALPRYFNIKKHLHQSSVNAFISFIICFVGVFLNQLGHFFVEKMSKSHVYILTVAYLQIQIKR